MITINTPQNIELSEFDTKFIQLVNNRITGYGQIPYTVPQQLIIDMIKDSARFFYKRYWRCGLRSFWFLDKKDIERYVKNFGADDRISQSYSVVLPPSVRNVEDIMEIGERIGYLNESNGNTDNPNYEYSSSISSPLYYQSSPYGQSLIGINQMLYTTNYAVRLTEQAALQSIAFQSVPFNFNITTKRLNIHKNVYKSFVLRCIVDIPIQLLYDDELFERYVIAKTKKELKRVISSHTIELPGGVQLNPDEICDNLEDIENIENILKESSGVGDIIMIR